MVRESEGKRRDGVGQQIELAVSLVIYRHRAILRARHSARVSLELPRFRASRGETRRGIGGQRPRACHAGHARGLFLQNKYGCRLRNEKARR